MSGPVKFGDVEGALRVIARAAQCSVLISFSTALEHAPVTLTADDGPVLGEGRTLAEAVASAAGVLYAEFSAQREDQYKKLELTQAIAAELRGHAAALTQALAVERREP